MIVTIMGLLGCDVGLNFGVVGLMCDGGGNDSFWFV